MSTRIFELRPLEQRVLLSAAIVDVNWAGHTGAAYEGQYVIELGRGIGITTVAQRNGFTDVQSLGGNGFYSFHTDKSLDQMKRWFAARYPLVTGLSPNYVVHAQATEPNDPFYLDGTQWHLNNTGQTINDPFDRPVVGVADADIDAPEAWDISTGSKNVVVAVLDTGLDITLDELKDNVWTNPGEIPNNGIDDDSNGFIDDVHGYNAVDQNTDITDENGHGTHVAGIIGAKGNNALGVAGINWDVSIIGVKVLGANGSGTLAGIIRGIQYVTTLKNSGIDVTALNLSLSNDQLFPFDRLMNRALALAGEAGVLAVVAAANGGADRIGDNLDTSFTFPGKFSLNLPNVITVAATDNQDKLAFFSNFGPQTVAVAAPGVSIISTVPLDSITEIPTIDGVDNPLFDGLTDGYTVFSGTSQAAPMVTGILALAKSVNPQATPMQLKQALLEGVDVLPSLSAKLSGPRVVSTAGRVNAYKTLRAIQEQFLKTDSVTLGNWQGVGGTQKLYGTEAAFVAGESAGLPNVTNLVTVTQSGASTAVFRDFTRDPRALQTLDRSSRIVGALVSGSSMDLDFNFTDGNAHRVALYMVDFDLRGRSQRIDVIDPTTGAAVSGQFGQTVSRFGRGRYLVYELRGHVILRVTRLAGPSAVINGLFIDPAVTSETTFVGSDSITAGNWRNRFGGEGAFVVGDSTSFPSFVVATVEGGSTMVREPLSIDPRALERPSNTYRRVKAYVSTPSVMTLDLNFTDGKTHRTTFYIADYERLRRAERIEVIENDPLSADFGKVLTSQDAAGFAAGRYLSFDLSGHKLIRITRMAGAKAVFSGVFFDSPPGSVARFIQSDATTHGNWKGRYGSDASYLVGDNPFTTNPFTLPLTGDNQSNTVNNSVQITIGSSLGVQVPTGDSAVGNWTTDSGGTTNLYQKIDETVANANDTTDFIKASNDTNNDVYKYMLPATPAGFSQMLALNFNLRYRQQGRSNDTYGLQIRVVSGSTILAAADGAGAFQNVAANIITSSFINSGTTAFTYVNHDASRSAWNSAVVELRQTYSQSAGADGGHVEVSAADINGTYNAATTEIVAESTTAIGALQKTSDSFDRINARLASRTSMNIDLNFADKKIHRVSLYALDSENQRRIQLVQIIDPDTGAVLASQLMSRFQRGKYVTFDVRGHVVVHVVRVAGVSAVVNGLFFD